MIFPYPRAIVHTSFAEWGWEEDGVRWHCSAGGVQVIMAGVRTTMRGQVQLLCSGELPH